VILNISKIVCVVIKNLNIKYHIFIHLPQLKNIQKNLYLNLVTLLNEQKKWKSYFFITFENNWYQIKQIHKYFSNKFLIILFYFIIINRKMNFNCRY